MAKKIRRGVEYKRRSSSVALRNLSENTKNALRVVHVAITSLNTNIYKEKYSMSVKKQQKNFIRGYDLLQYNIAVRPYIIKKYGIENNIELDMLLYLFPIQYFTHTDFKTLPYIGNGYSAKRFVELGYIEICVQKNNQKLYSMTSLGLRIVKDYYAYLSGEKIINKNSTRNPFVKKNVYKVDKIREKLMERLKKESERNPSKFRKALFLDDEE